MGYNKFKFFKFVFNLFFILIYSNPSNKNKLIILNMLIKILDFQDKRHYKFINIKPEDLENQFELIEDLDIYHHKVKKIESPWKNYYFFTGNRKKMIKNLYLKGFKMGDGQLSNLAKKIGCNTNYIIQLAFRNKWKNSYVNNDSEEVKKAIKKAVKKLYDTGFTVGDENYEKTLKDFDLNQNKVKYIERKYGLENSLYIKKIKELYEKGFDRMLGEAQKLADELRIKKNTLLKMASKNGFKNSYYLKNEKK